MFNAFKKFILAASVVTMAPLSLQAADAPATRQISIGPDKAVVIMPAREQTRPEAPYALRGSDEQQQQQAPTARMQWAGPHQVGVAYGNWQQ
jgi:hypothetical protein